MKRTGSKQKFDGKKGCRPRDRRDFKRVLGSRVKVGKKVGSGFFFCGMLVG